MEKKIFCCFNKDQRAFIVVSHMATPFFWAVSPKIKKQEGTKISVRSNEKLQTINNKFTRQFHF
jgi:hypothetical protein